MKLETRTCACGCGRTFRVMKESKQLYFSARECAKEPPLNPQAEYAARERIKAELKKRK